MKNTCADEVIASFESSFTDKHVIPDSLEFQWLKRAIGKYSLELDHLNYDDEIMMFDCKLEQYVIDTLAAFMKQFYQERQVSLVNKRIRIVGKDISVGESDNSKKYTEDELTYSKNEASQMVNFQKPTALL